MSIDVIARGLAAQARGSAIVSRGAVTGATVVSPGANYGQAPIVTDSGGSRVRC